MFTLRIVDGVSRAALTCDVCGYTEKFFEYEPYGRVVKEARSVGWTMGFYHTCPSCEAEKKEKFPDLKARRKEYNRRYREGLKAKKAAEARIGLQEEV